MPGVIVMAHGRLAGALLESAAMILGQLPANVVSLNMGPDDNLEKMRDALVETVRDGQYLVLTDLAGGTPTNAAAWAAGIGTQKMMVVTGVNLAMLLEVLTEPAQTGLHELADLAVSQGRRGVRRLDLDEEGLDGGAG